MATLTGKVALVTGGSRGIGAGIARRLAREGADVAVTYLQAKERAREVVDAIAAEGRRGLVIPADSADSGAVVGAVERTAAELGGLDILVNNAGITSLGPVDDVTVDDLDRIYAVHVRAAVLATQAAVPHMGAGGRVVSIGSCLAGRVPGPGWSLYAMSKAALVGLTKGLARDLGPRGITVNVVQPGPIDTDMNPADGEHADGERALLALDHFGHVDDVAATVAHLAGPEGRFITGAAIDVDGGWAA
jgi:NAD(P)-dependent dehydrogenase (short-subunit alcohol dehydrogenase family)